MFRFEKLDVWQKAIEFADLVYTVTRNFPENERFGLTSQLRKAAVSISSNVAEGSGRSSDADFALMEAVSQLHIAEHQQFIGQAAFQELYQLADKLARMLSGLRSSLTGPRSGPPGPRPSTLDTASRSNA